MALPTWFGDEWPYICTHDIPGRRDSCDCGLRTAYPQQLQLFTWAELHPVMAEFFGKYLAGYKEA